MGAILNRVMIFRRRLMSKVLCVSEDATLLLTFYKG